MKRPEKITLRAKICTVIAGATLFGFMFLALAIEGGDANPLIPNPTALHWKIGAFLLLGLTVAVLIWGWNNVE